MRTVAVMLMALAAYGAPRYESGIVDRTLHDLRRASWNGRLDGHERNHFNSAVKELEKFQDRWRDGRFDTGRLDKAIDSLRHLANADRLHPRDRSILASDLEALRNFRAGRGYGGPHPRGGPGWPR